MKYLIVEYVTKPNGSLEENVAVSKRLKTRDWQQASVILDFEKQAIVKGRVQNMTIERPFGEVVEYFREHYPGIVADLEKINQPT